ncbi:MAG TPA: VOC family protein [Microbacterium sp.]|nr:VOC family protein [Microbacterium sp.]
MSVTRLFPILRSDDLAASIAFYERAFSAEVTYRFAPEGGDVVYVALAVGGGTIGIGFEPEVARGDAIALWIYTDDLEGEFAAAVQAGAEVVSQPQVMPWGERVAELRDPDGNHLYLGLDSA